MKQFNVTGMSCAACSARVEKAVSSLENVTECSVNLLTNSMTVEGSAPVENIIADFTTYDLIKENNEEKINRLKDMKFDVIVGNPPYQKSNGGGLNKSSGTAIYDDFVTIAKSLSPRFINMIMVKKLNLLINKFKKDIKISRL